MGMPRLRAAWAGGALLPLLLVLLTCEPSVVTAQEATLQLIDDPTGMAQCLDGSPMAYYYRPGHGSGASKWLISYEGGGWCTTMDTCLSRSKGPLGSSKEYKPSTTLLLGKLTGDESRNPTFWNHHTVYVKYCDGAFFSGNVTEAVTHQGEPLYFRGRHIHAALARSLMERGLGDATDIVISGCSAGAVQTFLNVDYIASLMPRTAHVVGLPDSGFLVAYEGPGACQYTEKMVSAFPLQNVAAALPQQCLDKFAPTGEEWRCMFFSEHIVPYIQTPLFVLQSKYDYWQMDDNIYCDMFNVAAARAFGKAFEATFLRAFRDRAGTGYLLDSCTHHCGGWDLIRSDDGLTQHSAFEAWYASTLPDSNAGGDDDDGATHKHNQAGLFPCLTCCVEGVWGDNPTPHIKEEEDLATPVALLSLQEDERDEEGAVAQPRRQRRLHESELAAMQEVMKLMAEVKDEHDEEDGAVLSRLHHIVQSFVPLPQPMDGKGKGGGEPQPQQSVEVNAQGGAAAAVDSKGRRRLGATTDIE